MSTDGGRGGDVAESSSDDCVVTRAPFASPGARPFGKRTRGLFPHGGYRRSALRRQGGRRGRQAGGSGSLAVGTTPDPRDKCDKSTFVRYAHKCLRGRRRDPDRGGHHHSSTGPSDRTSRSTRRRPPPDPAPHQPPRGPRRTSDPYPAPPEEISRCPARRHPRQPAGPEGGARGAPSWSPDSPARCWSPAAEGGTVRAGATARAAPPAGCRRSPSSTSSRWRASPSPPTWWPTRAVTSRSTG